MTFLETVIGALSASILVNPYFFFFVAIIAVALWGDASMILLSIAAFDLGVPFWIVIFGGYLGAQIGDCAWFLLGKKILPFIEKHKLWGKHYKNLFRAISGVAHKNILVTLSIVKFLYGTRVLTLIYFSHRKHKLSFAKFFYYNSIALLLWIAFMGSIGYLVALGFNFVFSVVKSIELTLGLLFLFFVLLNLIQRYINKKLENKSLKIKK